MSNMEKIFLDARELEHPKPLEMAMSSLRNLNEHNYFYMLHRKHPIPLLDMAHAQDMQILSKEDSNGNWHIIISKNDTVDLDNLVIDIKNNE